MRIVNIHEAKTHLSRLIELAAKGEAFIIAKAGKPMVKVTSDRLPCPTTSTGLGLQRSHGYSAMNLHESHAGHTPAAMGGELA
jgi:antitoxin (DNA-binding transcriptional repressor) of toxin-antitoxin stability system